MNPTTTTIIAKLGEYKQQKLTYYQATQNLLLESYTQSQIDDAEDELNEGIADKENQGNQKAPSKSLSEIYAETGQNLLQNSHEHTTAGKLFTKQIPVVRFGLPWGAVPGWLFVTTIAIVIVGLVLVLIFVFQIT